METDMQKSLFYEDDNKNKRVNIDEMNSFHSFIVCSKSELVLMSFKDKTFQTQDIPFEKYEDNEDFSEIICTFFIKNDTTFTKKDSLNINNKDSKSLYIICGHLNGSVTIWNTGGFISN